MGNKVVIPSMGNWYVDYLNHYGITVKKYQDSGTFSLTLECLNHHQKQIIVKAYQSDVPLKSLSIVESSESYFKKVRDSKNTLENIGAQSYRVLENCAFLIRQKYEFTLSQRLEEYPPLENIEKFWISYQILSSLKSLHSLGLVHGSINPENVFLSTDLDVKISDLSPFKPSHINENMPQLFHHYFTTASKRYCYLAPEQILDKNTRKENVLFNLSTFSMDLFSLGLVLYYLYTEEHLLTFSDLIEYKKGKFDIKDKLNYLPKEIYPIVKSLLSLMPDKRVEIFNNFHEYFPPSFYQLSNQFSEIFNSEIELKHIISLIPSFKILIETSPKDSKLIFLNIFLRYLFKSKNIQETIYFENFICEYSLTLFDEFKLNRVLPHFFTFLKSQSDILKSNSLLCIWSILKTINDIPDQFELVFKNYVTPNLLKAINNSSKEFRVTAAYIFPFIITKINQLQDDVICHTLKIVNFLINENEEMIIQSFVKSMCLMSSDNNQIKCYCNTFKHFYPILLSCLNSKSTFLRKGVIQILECFYDNSVNEKNLYKKLYKDISLVVLGVISGLNSEDIIVIYLKFLFWLVKNDLFPKSKISELYYKIYKYRDPMSTEILKFYSNKIIEILTVHYDLDDLSIFVENLIHPTQYNQINKNYRANKIKSFREKNPLMINIGVEISTKFLHSTKISRSQISIISPIHNDYMISLITDKNNNVYSISKNYMLSKMFSFNETINDITEIRSTNSVAISNNLSKFFCIDMNELKIVETKINLDSPIVKLISTEPNIVYGLTQKGDIFFYDKRDSIQHVVSFGNYGLSATSLCSWNNNVLLGAGFKEGLVNIFDTRIMLPVSTIMTEPVKSIVPICRNFCNFFVTTPENIVCYDVNAHKPEFSLNIPNSFGLSYDGNGIIINNDNVVFLNSHSFLSSKFLYDDNKKFMIDSSIQSTTPKESLHKHIFQISCANHTNDIFITGDNNGFVHFWDISHFK